MNVAPMMLRMDGVGLDISGLVKVESTLWRVLKNQPTFSSTDLAALVRDAVVEGEPHEQVLCRWRRVVVVLPQNTLCQPHRPLDGPVRCDHHPDPSSRDLHLI